MMFIHDYLINPSVLFDIDCLAKECKAKQITTRTKPSETKDWPRQLNTTVSGANEKITYEHIIE